MTLDDLLDAWRVNNAVTLELLDLIPDTAWDAKPGGGKTVRSNFSHIVGVRRMWAEEKLPEKASTIPKLDVKSVQRPDIHSALTTSHDVMVEVFLCREASVRPPKWSTLTFFAYLVAHEAHHRAQIEIALRLAGQELSDQAMYRLWEWQKK